MALRIVFKNAYILILKSVFSFKVQQPDLVYLPNRKIRWGGVSLINFLIYNGYVQQRPIQPKCL